MVMTRRQVLKELLLATCSGFAYGCGAFDWFGGAYAIGQNFDGRGGLGGPGPREVVDRTGIAAGYEVVKQIKHNDVNILITTNGTNSIIYRQESGVWAAKETVNTAVCTDVVSYNDGTNSILAWCFGNDAAFRYSVNNGTDWTASTFAGVSDNPEFFLSQQNSLDAPRVLWVVNPNLIYFATSLVNGTTVTTSSTVGDAGTDEYFTNLVQDDLGNVLIAKRRTLWRWTNGPAVLVAGPYNDPPLDAGGHSDRRNFETHTSLGGALYFVAEGYKIIEVFRGVLTSEEIAPRIAGKDIPRMDLPINALAAAGGWLIAAIGSANASTLRNVANAPGSTALLQNTFATTSELYAGKWGVSPRGERVFIWHGSLLTCTDMLRYMWFDEDDSYLYLASGGVELINAQQLRCYFFTDRPGTHAVSSVVTLNTGTWRVEMGKLSFPAPVQLTKLTADTIQLASTVPSLEVQYRGEPDYEATAYSSLVTWLNNYDPERGCKFPPFRTSRECWLQFIGVGDASNNLYAFLESAKLYGMEYPLAR